MMILFHELIRWLQSVLVTVDRHEWYAPPQIYTRDDSTGLWIAKPPFQSSLQLLSSGNKHVGILAGQPVPLTGEPTCVGHMCQDNNQKLADGITRMETNNEDASENSSHNDASDGDAKKRRVETDMSNGGSGVAETRVEKSSTMQDDVLMDYQGAIAANASIAERVVEPTLVMFEVTFWKN